MTERTQAVIVEALRTPVVRRGGAFARLPAWALAAPVLAALVERLPAGTVVDDVLLGSSRPEPGNLARLAALAATGNGPPGAGAAPGLTLDRQCGSGLEAVRLAAALVGAGEAEVVLAGGVDSASRTDAAAGVRSGPSPQAAFAPPGFPDPGMGEAADRLAASLGITRRRQDRYAVRSHARTRRARDAGWFEAELVAVDGVAADDRPRALTEAALARLRPVFRETSAGGTVTPGTACGIADGAAAVTVVDEAFRASHGLPGLRVLAGAVRAGDPAMPGLGALEASRAVLDRAGVKPGELAVLEVTEAFAAQVLALTDGLGVDELDGAPAVCPDGGALALGHPWGASGALLLVRLFSRLVRRGAGGPPTLGLATCPTAGGQGVALLVESVAAG